MRIQQILAVYFSPTGTTRKVVERTAEMLSDILQVPHKTLDFTLPKGREHPLRFNRNDLVVFGMPVYAGRLPNLLLKFLDTLEGNHGLAIPIVLYGNRNYDDALIELRDILENKQLHTIAAGAFIGEHSFSTTLGQGRPDATDIFLLEDFVRQTAEEIVNLPVSDEKTKHLQPVPVKGTPYPYNGYYKPKDAREDPIDIRKVKPLTNTDCNDCMICVHLCPMGSISHENPRDINGVCIKCGACVKGCSQQAKYYVDEKYLYHKLDLEESFAERKEPQWFLL